MEHDDLKYGGKRYQVVAHLGTKNVRFTIEASFGELPEPEYVTANSTAIETWVTSIFCRRFGASTSAKALRLKTDDRVRYSTGRRGGELSEGEPLQTQWLSLTINGKHVPSVRAIGFRFDAD